MASAGRSATLQPGERGVFTGDLRSELDFLIADYLKLTNRQDLAQKILLDSRLSGIEELRKCCLAGDWKKAVSIIQQFVGSDNKNPCLALARQELFYDILSHTPSLDREEQLIEVQHALAGTAVYKNSLLLHAQYLDEALRTHPDNPRVVLGTKQARQYAFERLFEELQRQPIGPADGSFRPGRLLELLDQAVTLQAIACGCITNGSPVHVATLLRDHQCSERVTTRPAAETVPSVDELRASPTLSSETVRGLAHAEPSPPVPRKRKRTAEVIEPPPVDDIADLRAPKRARTEVVASTTATAPVPNAPPPELPRSYWYTIKLQSTPTAIAFHPRFSNYITVGVDTGGVLLYDVKKRRTVSAVSSVKVHAGKVSRLAWDPSGQFLAVCRAKHIEIVKLQDTQLDMRTLVVSDHTDIVTDVAWITENEKLILISGSYDGTIRGYGISEHGKTRLEEWPMLAKVVGLCPCPPTSAKSFFYASSQAGTLKRFYLNSKEPDLTVRPPGDWISGMVYTRKGRLFACGKGVGSLVELDPATCNTRRTFEPYSNTEEGLVKLAVSPGEQYLCVPDGRVVRFWNLESLSNLSCDEIEVTRDNKAVVQIALHSEGRFLATIATHDQRIMLYGLAEQVATFRGKSSFTEEAIVLFELDAPRPKQSLPEPQHAMSPPLPTKSKRSRNASRDRRQEPPLPFSASPPPDCISPRTLEAEPAHTKPASTAQPSRLAQPTVVAPAAAAAAAAVPLPVVPVRTYPPLPAAPSPPLGDTAIAIPSGEPLSRIPSLLPIDTLPEAAAAVSPVNIPIKLENQPRVLLLFPKHKKVIRRILYSHDATSVWAFSEDFIANIWATRSKLKEETEPEKAQVITGHPDTRPVIRTRRVAFALTPPPHGDMSIVEPCMELTWNNRYALISAGGALMSATLRGGSPELRELLVPNTLHEVVTALALHPKDSNSLVLGRQDGSITLLHIPHFNQALKLPICHTRTITSLVWILLDGANASTATHEDIRTKAKSTLLISAAADGTVCFWDMENLIPQQKVAVSERDVPVRLDIHPKDKKLLLIVTPNELVLLSVDTRSVMSVFKAREVDFITAATYSCDGAFIYCCLHNGKVLVLNAANLQLRRELSLMKTTIPDRNRQVIYGTSIDRHPTIPTQFCIGSSDGTVRIISMPSGMAW